MNLQLLTEGWNEITTSPAWVIVALILNILSFLWAKVHWMDNKWIPVVCVFGGGVLYFLVGPHVVNPQQPHPQFMKFLLGMVLGAGSFAAHGSLMAFLRSKFPGFMPDSTATDKIEKSNEKNPV